jgi:hypothetical protein
MAYLKYIQYFYFIAAMLFVFDGIHKFNTENGSPWVSFFFAALALFLFFFRRHFANKYKNQNPKK